MRRLLFRVGGLCLAPLVGLALTHASELGSTPAVPGPIARPVQPVRPIKPIAPLEKTEAACGSHGTSVEFVDTPAEAAKIAKKEQKLVFVLHVSGNFEDPRFT
jgi:hypothetical protein